MSHQEESKLNSQSGLPAEITAQNAHGEKKTKQNFGMLWDPELADEMLKWLRAAIIVYAPTTIKHQKCVLIRKKR